MIKDADVEQAASLFRAPEQSANRPAACSTFQGGNVVAKQSKLYLALGLCLILMAVLLGTTAWGGQDSDRTKCQKDCETQYQACKKPMNANQAACSSALAACKSACKDMKAHPSPTATVSPSPEVPTGTPSPTPEGTPSTTPSPTPMEPTPTPSPR